MVLNEFVQKDLIAKQLLAMTQQTVLKKKFVPQPDINFVREELITVFWLRPIQTVPHVMKAITARHTDRQ